QFTLHPLDFFRVRSKVEQEQAWNESLHLAGADIISETHLLSDTNKEPRAQITARFVNQLECVSIVAKHVRATITNHYHTLRFILNIFHRNCPDQRLGPRSICESEFAWLHSLERFLEDPFHICGLDVPKDGNDPVPSHEITVAKRCEI